MAGLKSTVLPSVPRLLSSRRENLCTSLIPPASGGKRIDFPRLRGTEGVELTLLYENLRQRVQECNLAIAPGLRPGKLVAAKPRSTRSFAPLNIRKNFCFKTRSVPRQKHRNENLITLPPRRDNPGLLLFIMNFRNAAQTVGGLFRRNIPLSFGQHFVAHHKFFDGR